MKPIVCLMRPQQWLKNLFIFLPLFFDRHLLDAGYALPAVVVFMAFCLASSGIYCLNDICDAEADRNHPVKCRRPIASGAVGRKTGGVIALACLAAAFAATGLLACGPGRSVHKTACIIAAYIVVNTAYCFRLKQIPVVDVFVIAAGFVMRVLAGGVATGIRLSHWIVLMTFLLALLLAFAKRRDDVVMQEENGVTVRRSIGNYNPEFMDQTIGVLASVTMVCYIMYTVSPDVTERFGSTYVYVTSVFVLAGIIHYLQLTIVSHKSGSPTKVLLNDRFIQLCLVCWMTMFALILYL